MHTFYVPDLSIDLILLDEDESKHAVRVLRLKKEDPVILTDGKGMRAEAKVAEDHAKRCLLVITKRTQFETGRTFRLQVAVAPTKNIERLEWFLEKAVEIGIDRLTLIQCEHSERTIVKIDRLEKIAIAAMKQSQQYWLPTIDAMQDFNSFVKQVPESALRLMAHCGNGEKKPLKSLVKSGNDICILIGPEGDFSSSEIAQGLASGFTAVSLGQTRLRTETAALVAVTTAAISA
jgi:16S rRNA (uracil1498-N3)-methyltransferase